MNVLGAIGGVFLGVVAGGIIRYAIPQLDGTLHQVLACVGISFVGWKLVDFFDSDGLGKWMYLIGLLAGYFGLPYVFTDFNALSSQISKTRN